MFKTNATYLKFHFIGNAICELLQRNAATLLVVDRILYRIFLKINIVIDSSADIHLILKCLVIGLSTEASSALVELISGKI
jgi:hypothetical protein